MFFAFRGPSRRGLASVLGWDEGFGGHYPQECYVRREQASKTSHHLIGRGHGLSFHSLEVVSQASFNRVLVGDFVWVWTLKAHYWRGFSLKDPLRADHTSPKHMVKMHKKERKGSKNEKHTEWRLRDKKSFKKKLKKSVDLLFDI